LTATPKRLPPKWFYDEEGCELFDQITRLAEYYPTRREREILESRAPEIAGVTGAETLVELGSGTSEKTRLLLRALTTGGTLRHFVPFDVSEPTLTTAGRAIEAEFPGLDVHGVVGDFERHLGLLPPAGRRLVAFLGGTIGNLTPPERSRFFQDLVGGLAPGDSVLIGADLVKDPDRLRAAYDDSRGVTAEFNRNLLVVLNRELDANFRPEDFSHVAVWDADNEWIEMRLRSDRDQHVDLPALERSISFARGEELRTEVSAKFRRESFEAELRVGGLEPVHWWTDAAGDFALSLSSVAAPSD
jgi:L-histidine N-alpha-methyltransferase